MSRVIENLEDQIPDDFSDGAAEWAQVVRDTWFSFYSEDELDYLIQRDDADVDSYEKDWILALYRRRQEQAKH